MKGVLYCNMPEYYYSHLGNPYNHWFLYNGFYHPYFYWHPHFYSYPGYITSYQNDNQGIINQTSVKGKATWTEGGKTTKCGTPWSVNNYMTTAVAVNSPYKCGQTLKVTNLSVATPEEITVTVVDTVEDFPLNYLNLHKRAFEALGSPASVGVINIEVTPVRSKEYEKWSRLLISLLKNAYPKYRVIDFEFIGSENISENQTRDTFDYILQSNQMKKRVRIHITFNPKTDQIIAINFEEQFLSRI